VINFLNNATAGSLTHFTNTGDITFGDSATAGNASFTNNAGLKFGATSTAGNATVTNNAEVLFFGNSTAGNATFTNAFGIVIFSNQATAGNATFVNAGGTVSETGGGFTVFQAGSTAGNATVISNGALVSDAFKGKNLFEGDAGSATLIANGGSNGGEGGFIQYRLGCTGGTARVSVFGNGTLDISQHDTPGVTTGSIQGNGLVFLGGVNLTVGANNLSTTFSGLMQDGGFSGGTGGSLAKIGTGTLTLSGVNTYTGGTFINAGILQGSQDGALGEGDVSVTASGAILRLQTGATNNYIADAATLSIVSGSTADLNFNGTPDTVRSLIVDGVGQLPGLYGSAASGAPHQLPQFAGTGTVLAKMVAVSRKIHGVAGDFDINLPFRGGPGIESRSGGVNGNHQVVVTFVNPVTLDGAAVSEGTGMVSSITGNGTTVVTVNLTGITNGQRVTLDLVNVNDGTTTETIPISMGMLIGDTNGDGVVNAGDTTQTRSRSGQTTDATNFRSDVNSDGTINSGDQIAVRSRSGMFLP
jgi:autotransporter-associated beta strand protein